MSRPIARGFERAPGRETPFFAPWGGRLSPMRHPSLRWWGLGAVLLAIAGCSDCGSCANPPPPPATEISLGLTAGNFGGQAFAHTDIVTTSTVFYSQVNPGNLKTYLQSGPGAYASPLFQSDGNDPLYLASADLNSDNLADVVSASYNDGVLNVFLNNPQTPGRFSGPIQLSSPGASQVAIGDLNGDGLPDLVSADFNVSLFLQTGPGLFGNPITLYTGGANWVAVGDLNGDGLPDVALTDAVGVKVLMQVPPPVGTKPGYTPTFAAPIPVFTQTVNADMTGANLIAIADVNGDGLNDLVITDPGPAGGAAPTVSVLLQDATHKGQFLAPVPYRIAPNSVATSIVVTPLVHCLGGCPAPAPGPDIVIGGSSAVNVLLNKNAAQAGTFGAATNYTVTNANEIAVADINADGLKDIIVGTAPTQSTVNGVVTNSPGVLLQKSSAPGTFSPVENLP